MTASDQVDSRTEDDDRGSAVYVYGVVPGGVVVEDNAQGVGDPPRRK